jgi:coenzyme F420-reducing hydrogenase beta subunit
MFTPNACNSCTDTFSETADIVIMDAWLPEYDKDYRGHSLFLVRNSELNQIIKSTITSLHVEQIDYSRVLESQKNVVINKKAVALGTKNFILKLMVIKRLKIQQLSRSENWMKNNKEIRRLILELKKYNKILWYISLPAKLILKVFNKIKNVI